MAQLAFLRLIGLYTIPLLAQCGVIDETRPQNSIPICGTAAQRGCALKTTTSFCTISLPLSAHTLLLLIPASHTSTIPSRSHQEDANTCVISDLMRHHCGEEAVYLPGHSGACPLYHSLSSMCLESGDGYPRSPFDDGSGRCHLARQTRCLSFHTVHRNETSAYRSRLPLILLPWRAAAVPTLSAPQRLDDRTTGSSDSSRCGSPFCTQVNRDPGNSMQHVGYEVNDPSAL